MNFKIHSDHLFLLKKTSRTLNFSFTILPPYIRYMLSYGYLVARAMDSVVDVSNIDNKIKIKFIEAVKNSVFQDSSNFFSYQFLKDLVENMNKYESELVINLKEIIKYFKSNLSSYDITIFRKLIFGLSNGMMIDICDFKEGCISNMHILNKYVSLIGGIPAIYWYDVYKNYKPSIFKINLYSSAYRIGKALQYTNILKDLNEDISKKRCYIPYTYLLEKNVNIEDLKHPFSIYKIKDFIRSVIIMCVDFFDESEKLISAIEPTEFTLKLSLIWPIYWAMDTLHLVYEKNPLKSKIKISKFSVYKTLLKSPLLLNNSVFSQGYRFRRETLMLSLNS
ncbi:MAG: squalene/phytoene synthase family protein [Elusimicrobiales bacterium]|nr:squalene/phytoene synthase family protein [Elusimicrobiales bacterium]